MELSNKYEELTERTLGPHGGLMANNLNSILQMENDSEFEDDDEILFKLSQYFDDQTIKNFCEKNNNGLNFMS